MKHLKKFNESKDNHNPDELAILVVKFLELMKSKKFTSIGDFKLVPSNGDRNMIKITEGGKPLYTIWVQTTEGGNLKVGGGIFGYYPGEYHTFAIVGANSTYINEKSDHKKCISKLKEVIQLIESGEKGVKGKFDFPIPDLSPRKDKSMLQIDPSKLKPETLAILRKYLKD